MLSLKSQISVLDNFVIREESISPVLAMMGKENAENLMSINEGLSKDVSFLIYAILLTKITQNLKFSDH